MYSSSGWHNISARALLYLPFSWPIKYIDSDCCRLVWSVGPALLLGEPTTRIVGPSLLGRPSNVRSANILSDASFYRKNMCALYMQYIDSVVVVWLLKALPTIIHPDHTIYIFFTLEHNICITHHIGHTIGRTHHSLCTHRSTVVISLLSAHRNDLVHSDTARYTDEANDFTASSLTTYTTRRRYSCTLAALYKLKVNILYIHRSLRTRRK